jgi:hypothetical protein
MRNVSNRNLTKLLKVITFSSYCIFIFLLVSVLTMPVVKTWTNKGSYIRGISGNQEFIEKITFTIDNLNALGDNNSVKWSGIRPIWIYEADLPRETLGRAYVSPVHCVIAIQEGLEDDLLENVLLHEILHCQGYDHTDTFCDIMYKYYTNCGIITYLSKLNYLRILSVINE